MVISASSEVIVKGRRAEIQEIGEELEGLDDQKMREREGGEARLRVQVYV